MYTDRFRELLLENLDRTRDSGTFKRERVLTTRQGTRVGVSESGEVLNFCANNYLGLSGDQRLVDTACRILQERGFGLSSVRFICGTQDLHRELEGRISAFLSMEDTILYSSCFDANGGLFEPLLTDADAIISDQLNHASIIDGIRLCKAKRYRYAHADLDDLEEALITARGSRVKAVVTDGVFSMDGEIAPLPGICDLADKYGALLIVDESHATGFIGDTGRGSIEYHGVMDRVDIVTSTFGKALGGASGGFTSGPREVVEILRQRSRPYLFSNTLAPVIAGTTLAVIDMIESSSSERDRLRANQRMFRASIREAGFRIVEGDHPIVPVLFGHLPDDAALAQEFADRLLGKGIYAIGFFYPIVPRGESRIRVQLSAAHTSGQIKRCVQAFSEVGRELGVI
ncbi:MAG: glycine C-acetyltransferase [Candidatus Fermentibacteraceae bacterium]|nr:glycine C-acetyltransferase [Candidatus Fermentibacteraceae bacterium]